MQISPSKGTNRMESPAPDRFEGSYHVHLTEFCGEGSDACKPGSRRSAVSAVFFSRRDAGLLQAGQIVVPAVLADGHDRVAGIVKDQHQRGADAAVVVGKIPAGQPPLAEQTHGRGMIIEIGHTGSMCRRRRGHSARGKFRERPPCDAAFSD